MNPCPEAPTVRAGGGGGAAGGAPEGSGAPRVASEESPSGTPAAPGAVPAPPLTCGGAGGGRVPASAPAPRAVETPRPRRLEGACAGGRRVLTGTEL